VHNIAKSERHRTSGCPKICQLLLSFSAKITTKPGTIPPGIWIGGFLMKECKFFQQLIVEDFYSEIDRDEKSKLEKHLEICDNCKIQSEQIPTTLNGMNQYKRPQPSEDFWNNYWINLESKLNKNLSINKKLKNIFSLIQIKPSWIYGFATAAAFLIIGIFLGKFYFTPPTANTYVSSEVSQKNIQTVATAERYLNRSKVLLLGIVNMDIETDLDYKPSISKQQQISKELIKQTAVLKEDLQEANQKLLLELVNELQTILLQIANLEKEYDYDAIELIQSSLDRKGILVKINLGQILSVSDNKNKNSSTKSTERIKQEI